MEKKKQIKDTVKKKLYFKTFKAVNNIKEDEGIHLLKDYVIICDYIIATKKKVNLNTYKNCIKGYWHEFLEGKDTGASIDDGKSFYRVNKALEPFKINNAHLFGHKGFYFKDDSVETRKNKILKVIKKGVKNESKKY